MYIFENFKSREVVYKLKIHVQSLIEKF